MHTLNFEDLYEYDAGISGITLPVELSFGGQNVRVLAKLDTGSTYCVFQRERGEELGLNIEIGAQEEISTPNVPIVRRESAGSSAQHPCSFSSAELTTCAEEQLAMKIGKEQIRGK